MFFLPVYFYYSGAFARLVKTGMCITFSSFHTRFARVNSLTWVFLVYLTMDPNVHTYHFYLDLLFVFSISLALFVFVFFNKSTACCINVYYIGSKSFSLVEAECRPIFKPYEMTERKELFYSNLLSLKPLGLQILSMFLMIWFRQLSPNICSLIRISTAFEI